MTTEALFQLPGRRALVTGGGGGLGRAIVEALADAGTRVAVLGRSDAADEAAARVDGIGVRADLSDRSQLRRGFAEAVAGLGGLDVLVTCHGNVHARPALELGLDDWDDTVEVNLTSVFELCQLAGALMVPRGAGKIVTIASMLSFQGRVRRRRVRRLEGRRGAAHQGPRQRVGAERRQRQRDRPRIREDGPQPPHLAGRSGTKRRHPLAPAGRTVGRARRPRRGGRLPRLPRCGLRARHRAAG